MYFHTYSTFLAGRGMYLHDLCVSAEYRGRALGTRLLRRVAATAVERGCGRFEWVALDWDTGTHCFYEDLGLEMLPDWRVLRAQGDALRQLAEDPDRSTDLQVQRSPRHEFHAELMGHSDLTVESRCAQYGAHGTCKGCAIAERHPRLQDFRQLAQPLVEHMTGEVKP